MVPFSAALVIVVLMSQLSIQSEDALDLKSGENFLQPLPPPESGWSVNRGETKNALVVEWTKGEGKDVFSVIFRSTAGGFPADEFRQISNQLGHDKCSPFETVDVTSEPINGFARSIWHDLCGGADGSLRTTLTLYITGKDAGYYVLRKWPTRASEEELKLWIAYFESISVCDTRKRRNAPCPQ
jgi:hypothetical protein